MIILPALTRLVHRPDKRSVDLVEDCPPAPAGLVPAERRIDHYWPASSRCSPFFPCFRCPARGPGSGNTGKTAKGVGAAAFLVAKPPLRWDKPSGGGTKSTNRKLAGVPKRCCKRLLANKTYSPAGQAGRGRLLHSAKQLRDCFRRYRQACASYGCNMAAELTSLRSLAKKHACHEEYVMAWAAWRIMMHTAFEREYRS